MHDTEDQRSNSRNISGSFTYSMYCTDAWHLGYCPIPKTVNIIGASRITIGHPLVCASTDIIYYAMVARETD